MSIEHPMMVLMFPQISGHSTKRKMYKEIKNKIEVQMIKKPRKKYTIEFKAEAIKLLNDQGYSLAEAGKSLGTNPSLLGKWKNQLLGTNPQSSSSKGNSGLVQEENRKLKEENKRLRMECEILKKATPSLPRNRNEVSLHSKA